MGQKTSDTESGIKVSLFEIEGTLYVGRRQFSLCSLNIHLGILRSISCHSLWIGKRQEKRVRSLRSFSYWFFLFYARFFLFFCALSTFVRWGHLLIRSIQTINSKTLLLFYQMSETSTRLLVPESFTWGAIGHY